MLPMESSSLRSLEVYWRGINFRRKISWKKPGFWEKPGFSGGLPVSAQTRDVLFRLALTVVLLVVALRIAG